MGQLFLLAHTGVAHISAPGMDSALAQRPTEIPQRFLVGFLLPVFQLFSFLPDYLRGAFKGSSRFLQ
jgi:hypothetical protein